MVFNNISLLNEGKALYTDFLIIKSRKIKYLPYTIYASKGFIV
ncbi:hypothetical protein SAMN02194393_00536 [Maledivibacter halophilus]|uniref:Uncharacterized protein n=1 Tax=Maledivibacter halophilus TaxID=36842 RepID=A0A1T5IML9_9FIRM|nr:hypothetical protein SAMN02194393_00536 [Maledivibacter halophilus]